MRVAPKTRKSMITLYVHLNGPGHARNKYIARVQVLYIWGAQAVTTCTQTYNIYIYIIDVQLTELLLLVMTTKCRQQLLLSLASIRKDLPYLPIATEM